MGCLESHDQSVAETGSKPGSAASKSILVAAFLSSFNSIDTRKLTKSLRGKCVKFVVNNGSQARRPQPYKRQVDK